MLANLQCLYVKPSFRDIDATLLQLNELMNQIQLVKVIIIVIEEVQLFLLSHPNGKRALTEQNLISYALIKLTKTRGMYSKGI